MPGFTKPINIITIKDMGEARTLNLDQIPKTAKEIASTLKGGEIYALIGVLGAGKTTFVKTIGKVLKIKHNIPSPTFVLMQTFEARLQSKKLITLYHLDLYRIKNFKEARGLGVTEFWGRPDTVTFIEWADKIRKYWPSKTKVIKFTGK